MSSLTGCQSITLHFAEPHFLKTGPNGPDTPQTFGAPYEHVSIPSDTRILDGYLVRALDAGTVRVAMDSAYPLADALKAHE